MGGLKIMRHVREYWKGLVAHTAGFTASGCPIGVEWEQTSDDSTTAATQWLVRAQLRPASGKL